MKTAAVLWAACWLGSVQLVHAQSPTQSWPVRPIRIIVGFSAGSATDISARMIGPKLSELWNQPVVIENRPGAGSSLANAMAAKAAPDGYTLLMVSTAFAINAVLHAKAPYDPIKDFTGVTQVGFSTGVLVIANSLGVKTLKELIAAANARPGKILFGSAGAGSGIHMSTVRFNMAAGIKTTHVAFKGQPEMLVEIIAGRIHYGIPGLGPALPMIRDNRVVPVAVVTQKRSPLLPDVPTVVEILPHFERDAAHGLLAPAGTPRPILEKIAKDVAAVLDTPDVKKQMELMNFVPGPTTPDEYTRIVHNQLKIFDAVARQAGLKSP